MTIKNNEGFYMQSKRSSDNLTHTRDEALLEQDNTDSKGSLSVFPEEVLAHIFSFLPTRDLFTMRLASTFTYEVTLDRILQMMEEMPPSLARDLIKHLLDNKRFKDTLYSASSPLAIVLSALTTDDINTINRESLEQAIADPSLTRYKRLCASAMVTVKVLDLCSSKKTSSFDLSMRNIIEGSKIKNRGHDLIINLSKADLRRCDLQSACLNGANLSGANLEGVNLEVTMLAGATLSQARMHRAKLYGTNLSMANLFSADLSEAILNQVNLSGAQIVRTNLEKALLRETNLNYAFISEANLHSCTLSSDQLYKTTFSASNLCFTLIARANFEQTTFEHVKLVEMNEDGSYNLHSCPAFISSQHFGYDELNRRLDELREIKVSDDAERALLLAMIAQSILEVLSAQEHKAMQSSQCHYPSGWQSNFTSYFFEPCLGFLNSALSHPLFNTKPCSPSALGLFSNTEHPVSSALETLRRAFKKYDALNKQYIQAEKVDQKRRSQNEKQEDVAACSETCSIS
jgi:hypothetical protein